MFYQCLNGKERTAVKHIANISGNAYTVKTVYMDLSSSFAIIIPVNIISQFVW